MSGPTTALPPEIAEVMTVTSVLYEKWTAVDGYGQQTYAAPVQINCWVEPASMGRNMGTRALRANPGQDVLDTDEEPNFELYFDGDDSRVRSFTLDDRFTPGGVGASGLKLKPDAITPLYGPPFDNQFPWLVIVSL